MLKTGESSRVAQGTPRKFRCRLGRIAHEAPLLPGERERGAGLSVCRGRRKAVDDGREEFSEQGATRVREK